MPKASKLTSGIIIGIFILSVFYPFAQGQAISQVSDLISTSWPGFPANHTVTFRASQDIPPGGKIVVTPHSNTFQLLPGLDYRDVDLATSSVILGPFMDREIAASSTADNDGLSVSTNAVGTSTYLQSITFTLNNSHGIVKDDFVRIELGTNAAFGTTSSQQIMNAPTIGSYDIQVQTFTAVDEPIERATAMVAMVEPIMAGGTVVKLRSNGRPTGWLSYGTAITIMSLSTNYIATCRFSTTASTSYAAMTEQFTYTGTYYHAYNLIGLANGHSYHYYIRCRDAYSVDDMTDYEISFQIEGQAGNSGDENTEGSSPGGGGGGSGGGSGGGFGPSKGPGTGDYLPYPPEPGLPGVVFSGFAYPSSEVTVLQDGNAAGQALGNAKGEFGAFLEALNQGIYTFSMWAEDPQGRKSSTFSTTFWVEEGTQSNVANIIISPTIEITKNELNAGDTIEAFGYSTPGNTVEVWLYQAVSGPVDEASVIKTTVDVNRDGAWKAYINTSSMSNGSYRIKARTDSDTLGRSDFSQVVNLSIGGQVEEAVCAGADLNGDGRVNLTDFSILLYYWNTSDACADQNNDGTVNLTDFSIMMFYWTG